MTRAPRLPLVCLLPVLTALAPAASAQAEVDSTVVPRLAASASIAVWIELVDKAPDAGALQRVAAAYDARAHARRAQRRSAPDLFDARDLPVAEHHVAWIEAAGAKIRTRSSWLNAVSAEVTREALAAVSALPCVRRIELVRPGVLHAVRTGAGVPATATFYGASQDQLDSVRLPPLHARGFTGANVVIAVLDTGFRLTHAAFNQPGKEIQVIAAYDFVDDDEVVGPEPGDDPQQHEHGTIVLGTLAAYQPNFLIGGAHDAAFVLAKVERVNSETQVEEDYFVAGVQFAEKNGADIISSSVGFSQWYTQAQLDGRTAKATIAINVATANGVHCVTAAGNRGHDLDPTTSSLIAPADAFDVITCGAVAPATLAISPFSSDGPTADGRVKPEVMAQGEIVWSVSPTDDSSLVSRDGTSMATPLVAGLVACLTQEHPSEAVATLRERVIKSASFGGPRPDPLFVYGYGIANAMAASTLSGSWTDLGGGVAGSSGMPRLAGSGPLLAQEPITVALTSARPQAPLALILGTAAAQFPLLGGTLVPLPALSLGLATDPAGSLTARSRWVTGTPTGFRLYFQCWILDPAAPFGVAASNGLVARTP